MPLTELALNDMDKRVSNRRKFTTVDQLEAAVGEQIGLGDWFEITQERVTAFGELTGDNQWIHVDVERAAKTDLGGTIAHGFMMLVLGAITRGYEFQFPIEKGLNYGLNKVRFVSPVLVGSRIRMRTVLADFATPNPGQIQITLDHTIEIESGARPAVVSQSLTRYYVKESK